MISRIHSKLGTAGFIIAIVALVAALGGGAYAAKQAGLNGKQKKEVKKIAKQFAGKNGADGAPGPQGPAGAPGAKGDKGDTGSQGEQGPKGEKGATGSQGPEGSPWTAGGTLPSGKTETGAWGMGPFAKTNIVPISFNIPLATAPEAVHFVRLDEKEYTGESPTGVTPVNCLGSAETPKALPGHVCFYEAFEFEEPEGWTGNSFFTNAFTSGATMYFNISEGQAAYGTWAVTAK